MKFKKLIALLASAVFCFSASSLYCFAADDEAALKEPTNVITIGEDETPVIYAKHDTLKGDVNGDGVLNSEDLLLVINKMLGIESEKFTDADAADMNDDGIINISDVCLIKSVLLSDVNDLDDTFFNLDEHAVDSFVPVGEFLFSELDKGNIQVGDMINEEKFIELAGEDSEVYLNTICPLTLDEEMKACDALNLDYLTEYFKDNDELYELLSDEELMKEMKFFEVAEIVEDADPEIDWEPALSAKGIQNVMMIFGGYAFVSASVHDENTIIIDNETGFLFDMCGIMVTRNDKQYEIREEFDDSNYVYPIVITDKAEGYDNVYKWTSEDC